MPYTRTERLAILGWLTAGALIGWAAAVQLWRAGWLHPSADTPQMLSVVALCMIATTIYGARRRLKLAPRLIGYPLFFAGLTWLMRPMATAPRHRLDSEAINVFGPFLVIMLIIGGIVAVVFAKPRADEREKGDLDDATIASKERGSSGP